MSLRQRSLSAALVQRGRSLHVIGREGSLLDWKGGVSPFHLESNVSLPDWKRLVSPSHSETGGLCT